MKQFFVSTLPGSLLFVDISDVGPAARFLPSHQFPSWNEAKIHFLSLGAPQEALDSAIEAVKKSGSAKLVFQENPTAASGREVA